MGDEAVMEENLLVGLGRSLDTLEKWGLGLGFWRGFRGEPRSDGAWRACMVEGGSRGGDDNEVKRETKENERKKKACVDFVCCGKLELSGTTENKSRQNRTKLDCL